MQDYIERIKQLKSERKMTTEDLSAASGVPVGTLSKILAGVSDSVKLSNIVAVSEALGVSLNHLVLGIEDNTNNFTLTGEEIRLIEDFRRLDSYGKELVSVVVSKERERVSDRQASAEPRRSFVPAPIVSRRVPAVSAVSRERRRIPLVGLPVSAGPGEYLDGIADTGETISIPDDPRTAGADFALRISGNSMEPKYKSGDVVLVENADAVSVGDLCVYVLDGSGYFKVFGGDCLISLNPEFGNIMLRDFTEVSCVGKVIGKLKKTTARQ